MVYLMKLVTLEKNPNIKISTKIEKYLNPDYIYIPYNKTNTNIKNGENVCINQKIGNYFSSISGIVIGINEKKYITIANNFKEKSIYNNKSKKSSYNKDNFTQILENMEVQNKKLFNIFKSLKKCKNIVVCAINDEMYVLNNIIILKQNITKILDMINKLAIRYKSVNNLIVFKNTENNIINSCFNVLESYPNINMSLVPDKYLISRPNILIDYLKLNLNDTLFLTVDDLVDLINITKTGFLSDTKIITISGNAIEESKIIKVKKYTKIKDLINKFIKISDKNYILLKNNILEGNIISLDDIIDDEIASIHFMKKNKIKEHKCMKCGKCIEVCPMGIDIIKQIELGTPNSKCINCGICSYICPAYIDLRKYISGDKK